MQTNQLYHLEPPYGLLNDPNALLWYEDLFYMFFQWNPLAKDHTHKDWGYFTTKDFINWNFKGQAIKANSFFDRNGVYSGTGIVEDGKIYLYYTGNTKPDGKRKTYQNLVISEDGKTFNKEGIMFITPSGFTEHIRDPKVFKLNNQYFLILGAQTINGYGSIILYKSPNPTDFKFIGILAYSNKYQMVECPNITFFNNDEALLNYGLQKRDNEKDQGLDSRSFYKVVKFDPTTLKINDANLDENSRLIDLGFDFYVPQTVKCPDGRILMVGWMSNMTKQEEVIFSKDSYNIHCMTMFREISLKYNRLIQRPIKEYYSLLEEDVQINEKSYQFNSRHWRSHITLEGEKDFFLSINDNEVKLSFNKETKTLTFSRINWVTDEEQSKIIEIGLVDDIEIWSDTSSIEFYINKGFLTLSARIYSEVDNSLLKIDTDNEIKFIINNFKKN